MQKPPKVLFWELIVFRSVPMGLDARKGILAPVIQFRVVQEVLQVAIVKKQHH